ERGKIPHLQGDRDPRRTGFALGADADRRGRQCVQRKPAAVRQAVIVHLTVRRAAELLASARQGLALTGAGVSAESGIPTFRGEGGLWTKYDPVKVSSIESFLRSEEHTSELQSRGHLVCRL